MGSLWSLNEMGAAILEAAGPAAIGACVEWIRRQSNMKTFLITGLPRSRTAWLSNFFTVGPIFCHHDLSAHCIEGVDAIVSTMRATDAEIVGNADSGSALHLQPLYDALGSPTVIHIHREFRDSVASFANATGMVQGAVYPVLKTLAARMEEFAKKVGAPTFDFDELDREDVIRDIWKQVAGDLPFRTAHWEKMKTLNVSLKKDALMRLVRR